MCINTKDGGMIVQGTQDDKESINEPWKKSVAEGIGSCLVLQFSIDTEEKLFLCPQKKEVCPLFLTLNNSIFISSLHKNHVILKCVQLK
jgi:hypothetical protein